jgi:hypothetical protein
LVELFDLCLLVFLACVWGKCVLVSLFDLHMIVVQ